MFGMRRRRSSTAAIAVAPPRYPPGMAIRRGRGEGNIRKRSDGRWEASIELDPKAGGRRRKYVYGRTRQEVVARVRAVQRLADAGLPQVDDRVRLGTFLDTWLEEVVKPNRDPATWRGYEANVRRHIKPTLGNKQLTKLTAADVQILLNDKAAEGFAPRTVQYIHATLRAALGLAVRWDLVPRNVATLVDPVTVSRAPVAPFTEDEVHRLLASVAEDRLCAFYTVAMAVGLRPSEALGLRWTDVDFDQHVVHVRHALERVDGEYVLKKPKSRTSRRSIPVPGVCVDVLRAHRRRQLEERLAAGELWQDRGLVFATPTGAPLSRSEVSRHFGVIQKRAGVPHHRFTTAGTRRPACFSPRASRPG